MTNHLFELAGNRKTETVIPKSKKKWYQGKPVVSAAILILIVLGWLPVCGTYHDKGSFLYGSVKL